MITRQEALQVGEHIAVVETALAVAELLAYSVVLIALHGEEVHVAVVARLIGDKGGVEARLPIGLQDPTYPRELLGRGCIGGGEDDGDTLVGGIGLGQHVGEGDEPLSAHRIQPWGRRAGIAVEAPAMSPGGLPEDEDVDLTLLTRALARGSVAEGLRGVGIAVDLTELLRRQIHIVEDAHGVDLGSQV